MRLIVTFKPSEVERELSQQNRRLSRDQRIALAREMERRIRACVAQFRHLLPVGSEIQPLTNVGCLLVNSPVPANVDGIRDAIRNACPEVEEVTEDFAMSHIAGAPEVDSATYGSGD